MKRSKRKPEEWRDVEGYEGYYQVSSHGRVKSLERIIECSNGAIKKYRERILKCSPNSITGYPTALLQKKYKIKGISVHRLVAEAFIPNPENKPTVDHKYGDKTNNYYQDLRWGTHQEQSDWARVEQGLRDDVGENNYKAILTNDQAKEIIKLLQKGNTAKSISKQYHISISGVNSINRGKNWNHILPEVPRPIFKFKNKKITTEKVEEIIKELQNTNKIAKVIAEEYNINRATVSAINTGRIYKEVLPHIQRPIRSKT